MKVLLIGVNRRVGVSEKSGKPYDICEASYLVPDTNGEKKQEGTSPAQWTYTAIGFRVQQMPCNPSAMIGVDQINSVKLVELQIEPMVQNPQRNWIVGIKQ